MRHPKSPQILHCKPRAVRFAVWFGLVILCQPKSGEAQLLVKSEPTRENRAGLFAMGIVTVCK